MPIEALILSLAIAVQGDVVILSNGNEIQGEVLKEDGDRVVVKFQGGTLELPKKNVREIRRQKRIEYLLEEGEKLSRRGDHDEAVEAALEATEAEPDSQRARSALLDTSEKRALHLADLGRYEEARDSFVSLLKLDPSNATAKEEIQVIDKILEDARLEEQKGRAEVASGNLELGVWRLKKIFDNFPGRRKEVGPVLAAGYVRQGDILLRKQAWTEAEALYLQALAADPESVILLRAQFSFSKAKRIEPLVGRGEFPEIEKLAQEGLDVDPANEPLRYYHGLALEGTGKARDAAEEFLAILDVKRPSNPEKVVSELRRQVEARLTERGETSPTPHPRSREVLPGDFRELRTKHFVISHRNLAVAQDVAFVAEQSYAATFRELGCATHLRSPIRILIYPTRDDYLKGAGVQSWSGGAHQVARAMGDLSEHRICSYQEQPRLTSGVLPHEIAHALLSHRLNYPHEIPLWANEGFAVLREPRHLHNYYRAVIRQEAKRKNLYPVASILGATAYPIDRVELFYGQAFSLCEFLISLEGTNTFVRFLKAIEASGSVDTEIRRFYRIAGIEALDNRWRSWFDHSEP